MKRVIIKVDHRDTTFRITLPKKFIQVKRWCDVDYLILEDLTPTTVILTRFIDGKALETDN